MERRFSRKDFFDLMWSKPLKDLAPEFGISDVALAKLCRSNAIPLPGRGYWPKLAAGKATSVALLPPRGFGVGEMIVVGRDDWSKREENAARLIAEEIPPAPVFRESLEALTERARKAIGKVTYVRDLKRTHGAISRLLDEDVKRSEKRAMSAHPSFSDRDHFVSPYERRRLRIANSIFLVLAKLGMKCNARGKNPSEFSISVPAGTILDFRLDAPQRKNEQYEDWREVSQANRPASDPLQLAICWRHEREDGIRLVWNDSREAPLEGQLQEIVESLVLALEMTLRAAELHRHRGRVEHRSRLIEDARKRKEEAEREQLLRLQRVEKARIDHLLSSAMSLRLANDLREYVRAVQTTNQSSLPPLSSEAMDQWTTWALEQAERIDPIRNGSFLAQPDESSDSHDADQGNGATAKRAGTGHGASPPAWQPHRWYGRIKP